MVLVTETTTTNPPSGFYFQSHRPHNPQQDTLTPLDHCAPMKQQYASSSSRFSENERYKWLLQYQVVNGVAGRSYRYVNQSTQCWHASTEAAEVLDKDYLWIQAKSLAPYFSSKQVFRYPEMHLQKTISINEDLHGRARSSQTDSDQGVDPVRKHLGAVPISDVQKWIKILENGLVLVLDLRVEDRGDSVRNDPVKIPLSIREKAGLFSWKQVHRSTSAIFKIDTNRRRRSQLRFGHSFPKESHFLGLRIQVSDRKYSMAGIRHRAYHNPRWHLKRTHRCTLSTGIAAPLGGLVIALFMPCASALLNGHNWSSSARAITGVVSTSAGVSLVPLQTEPGCDSLRWVVRAVWLSTYGVFLTCSYLSVTRNSHLYLFCSLLLAAHFTAGFAGTATSATEGILMFGPLAATICAALVYIPFRYSGSSLSEAIPLRRQRQGGVESRERRRPNSAPAQPRGNDGDLGVRAMTGILGVVV